MAFQTQMVEIAKNLSKQIQVNFGFPQESVFGRLLFVLKIQNLFSCVNKIHADDNTAVTIHAETSLLLEQN